MATSKKLATAKAVKEKKAVSKEKVLATNQKNVSKRATVPAKKVVAKKAVSTAKKSQSEAIKKVAPKKAAMKAAVKKAPVKKVAVKNASAKKVATKVVAKKVSASKKKADDKKTVASTQKVAKKAAPPKVATSTVSSTTKKVTPVATKKVVAKKVAPIKKDTKKNKKEVAPLKPVKVPRISTTAKKSYRPAYTPLEQRNSQMEAESIVRYSEEELQEFKDLIIKKLADAKSEVAYLQGMISRRDEMGSDIESRYMTMEDGTISMEREQQSQMISRQISFIDNLEKALIRIENKTYGICRVTGKLIDKARLRAVPHATLSMEAKLSRKNNAGQ